MKQNSEMGLRLMFTAIFYFLGLAGSIVAALFCCSMGKRAGQHVEMDFAAFRATAACLSQVGKKPTWDGNAKWHDLKTVWMGWCARCRETAILKPKALYSWARCLRYVPYSAS